MLGQLQMRPAYAIWHQIFFVLSNANIQHVGNITKTLIAASVQLVIKYRSPHSHSVQHVQNTTVRPVCRFALISRWTVVREYLLNCWNNVFTGWLPFPDAKTRVSKHQWQSTTRSNKIYTLQNKSSGIVSDRHSNISHEMNKMSHKQYQQIDHCAIRRKLLHK